MLTPAEMKQVGLLILERDARAVTEGLGRLGVVHFSEATQADGGELVSAASLKAQLDEVHGLLARVERLRQALDVSRDREAESVPYAAPCELAAELDELEGELDDALGRRRRLEGDIETEYQVLRDIEGFRPAEVSPEDVRGLSFLHFALGRLPSGEVAKVREQAGADVVVLPFRTPDGTQRLVALTKRAGRFRLETVLEGHGFEPEQIPERYKEVPSEIARKSQERLLALAEQQAALGRETAALAERHGGRLAAWQMRLRVDEQLLAAQAYFGHTRSTCLISGYVPTERVDALRQALLRLTGGRVVVEVGDPAADDPNIPTMMQNPALIKPFELLVAGYGHPSYGEIEPTAFVAVSFLLMFGVMFGDVGHGAVLVALGLALARRGKGEQARQVGQLLAMAGGAAMVVGWVFGSVFGAELLEPGRFPWGGWFVPMEGDHIGRLLVATIVAGIAVISLGVVLNVVNRVKARDWFAMVVDRFGLVGFIFYWGALGLGIRAVVTGAAPRGWQVALFVGLPLLVLFFREPLHYLMSRKGHARRPSVLGGLVEGFVDVLETLSAYVANTVSFVRVGAFALAHAAVCAAIYTTEEAVRGLWGGPAWSVLVVVGGNAFVIVLEGLVVAIQAMRLHYYEFFGKFFRGEGKAYEPFKLS